MDKKPCIWLTRPTADSEALAATLTHHGIDSVIAPVMHIAYNSITAPLPAKPDAILVTSRHSAPMLEQLPAEWHDIPTYCVGAATGTVAHDVGFHCIVHGESGVLDLLPNMVDALPAGAPILYLAGAETRADVTALLAAKNLAVESIIAYDAQAELSLAPELLAALDAGNITGVVFFSPKSARVAAELLDARDVRSIEAYCLSLPIAEAAGALPWRSIHACHTPTLDAMVHLIISRLDSKML